MEITFVYRSHYDGPLSKRVRRLDAPSIVAWFAQRMVRASKDPALGNEHAVGESKTIDAIWDELGGRVYGLSTIFERAKEHELDPPSDMAGLRRILHKHLYVEGDAAKNILVDDHSVRVLTDDDEVKLAYYFFDDTAIAEHPDRLAYHLHDEPRFPADAAPDDGEPFAIGEMGVPLREFTPAGTGAGATYACLFTSYDGDSLPGSAGVFRGVRLPELAAHMRAVIPDSKPQEWSAEYLDTWPLELRLLRAMLDPGDTTLAPAFARINRFPIMHVGGSTNHSLAGVDTYAVARREFEKLADGKTDNGSPDESIIDEHPHIALFAMHTTSFFGHQQWVLFDDRWAAAHPDLARSLLRYGRRWDPLADDKVTKPRAPRTPATPEKLAERAWKAAIRDRTSGRAYAASQKFAADEVIDHPKFGLGVVVAAADKIDVQFKDARRILVHKR